MSASLNIEFIKARVDDAVERLVPIGDKENRDTIAEQIAWAVLGEDASSRDVAELQKKIQ